jgi:hypothetical protein
MALSFDSLNSTIKCYGVQMSENYKKREVAGVFAMP